MSPKLREIMVNGTEGIFIEKGGRLLRHAARFSEADRLEDVIQQIVAPCNRVVNASQPIVDARLPDGARVHVVLPPVSIGGPVVTIRRFPKDPLRMQKLIALGSLSPALAAYLSALVRSGCNLFVSGGTGSGKTTFLNALSDSIPEDERVITIEDNAELQIRHVPNLVRLEARNANVEGCQEISIRDLIRASLRMRPTRIIVGEVRGGEAIDMIQAMNTGHDGSMSTGHANSARDMIARLETMVLMGMDLPLQAIRGQIAKGIDLIVHLGRLRDHTRRVLEIVEVTGRLERDSGEVELQPLFRFEETGQEADGRILGEWRKYGDYSQMHKCVAAGVTLPAVGP